MERHEEIKKGAWIGIFGNAVLAALKILVGLLTGSYAILADGIDTSTDIFTSFVILLSSRISGKPPDETHPYGHERAETIASKIISFVMFYAGASLLVESVKRLVEQEFSLELTLTAFIVVGISVAGKTFLFLYKLSLGRRLNSLATISDALNMRNDIMISGTVLAGMFAMKTFGWWWLDSLLAIFVSILILRTSFSVFYEAAYELMDGMKRTELDMYDDIFVVLERFPNVHNPHRMRIRRVGTKYFIEMDIEVDGKMSVKDAHELTVKIRKEMMRRRDDIEDVTIHVEPLGNVEEEGFGLKKGEEK
ncbi:MULTISPECIES: cation diffusion facilitator family transporter [unclassified Thermotoga]|uniref:cation diffusion facilitator family transporter n=1 Tax=unclassified Thermotoga TaxID=2631113 RepID=UPI000541BDB2|nr:MULTISPECIES: cation diffusion facilitator family transporter [unclassified Thermotoga]KAF2959652.1 cation diffusion facilitator family transporter [Thermotoga sp. 38H-to]KHC90678.1 cation diffusion facilitator family transporter [Thermotoga sp. Mc24]